jgi:hypothetical protein
MIRKQNPGKAIRCFIQGKKAYKNRYQSSNSPHINLNAGSRKIGRMKVIWILIMGL